MSDKEVIALALRFLQSNQSVVEQMIEKQLDSKQIQKLIENNEKGKKK